MSRNGERVARRLTKRHGFKFEYDASNYRIATDRIDVQRNVRGGAGCMQWGFKLYCHLARIVRNNDGVREEVEIGGCFGASTLLKKKFWHVYEDEHGIWIDGAKEDLTEC